MSIQKLHNILIKKTRFYELFTWVFDNFTFILTPKFVRGTVRFHYAALE